MSDSFWLMVTGIAVLLAVSSAVAGLVHWHAATRETKQVLLRIKAWWAIAGVVCFCLALGPMGVGGLVGLIIWLGRKEANGLRLPVWVLALLVAHLIGLFAIGQMHTQGRALVLMIMVLVSLNDVCQYLVGRIAGRHALAPSISPGKTVEGAIGGIACTTILAWVMHHLLPDVFIGLPGYHVCALGLVIGSAGIGGDLAISALKRRAAVKDAGDLLPGHGGILDRVDSLMAAAPLACYFLVAVQFVIGSWYAVHS